MLYCLVEFGKWVEITGYNHITFAAAEAFLKANRKQTTQNVNIQFFDAQLIATQEHLYFATLNALQAFQNKTNISKSVAMETMLYASSQRQIQKAIQRCGIKPESEAMAVVIIGDDQTKIEALLGEVTKYVGVKPDEHVLELTESKTEKIKATYGFTDEMLKTAARKVDSKRALVDLIVEQVALLATQL